jgi:hypothetical protein
MGVPENVGDPLNVPAREPPPDNAVVPTNDTATAAVVESVPAVVNEAPDVNVGIPLNVRLPLNVGVPENEPAIEPPLLRATVDENVLAPAFTVIP